MSRVRNADEFLQRFRGIRRDYERHFDPQIQKIRNKLDSQIKSIHQDQNLEAHARAYFVNALLAALNWRLEKKPEEDLPNLIPETPVRSQQSGHIRFLDYLGHDGQTNKTLLIVETKRPGAELPHTLRPPETFSKLPCTQNTPEIYSDILCRGLAGETLNSDWDKWLPTLKDYVQSIKEQTQIYPKRVVSTNGDWLIIFLNPDQAFGNDASKSKIHVFADRNDIENRFDEVFADLEHNTILGETPSINPSELPFYVEDSDVEVLLHGLRLFYTERKCIYTTSPLINVAPIVFLRSRYGAWLKVESPPLEFELPLAYDYIAQHIDIVDQAAKTLLNEVNQHLGTSLQPTSLPSHYDNEEAFQNCYGVTESIENNYILVTGDNTHYILPSHPVLDCSYHDWLTCSSNGVASDQDAISARSTSPRSFFMSTESHHCAHRDVSNIKAARITDENRQRCGPRSGRIGQAFCEIWRFEQYLCCKTCAFMDVCKISKVFQLPCHHKCL